LSCSREAAWQTPFGSDRYAFAENGALHREADKVSEEWQQPLPGDL